MDTQHESLRVRDGYKHYINAFINVYIDQSCKSVLLVRHCDSLEKFDKGLKDSTIKTKLFIDAL